MTEPVMVRVSPEILGHLAGDSTGPVLVLGVAKCEDGTWDMILRSVDHDMHTMVERYKDALKEVGYYLDPEYGIQPIPKRVA